MREVTAPSGRASVASKRGTSAALRTHRCGIGWPVRTRLVGWAHETDLRRVRVNDDRVASAPERVVWRLCTLVPRVGHLRIALIHLRASRDAESDEDPR